MQWILVTLTPPVDPDTGDKIGMGTPDYQTQYNNLQALAAKYSKFAVLPEGQKLIDRLNDAALVAHQNLTQGMSLDAHATALQIQVDSLNQRNADLIAGRLNQQDLKNKGAEDVAVTRAGAQIEVGAGHDQSRLGAAGIRSEAEQSRDYATRSNNYLALAGQATDKEERAALIKLSDGMFEKSRTAPAASPLPTVSVPGLQPSAPQSPASAPTTSAVQPQQPSAPQSPASAPTTSAVQPQPVYRVGAQKIWYGKTFEFNGATWNPVTP